MKKIFLLSILSLGILMGSFAQKRTITGKVTNQATGEPLEGVSVFVEKSKSGTSTSKNGTYTLEVKKTASMLIFSSVGFATQTAIIEKDKSEINVSLTPASSDNTEIVVVGYGTQKRSNVTGAISKYKNDKLDETAVSRLDLALQGKIAGLQVENNTYEAGAPPKVTVRGISSIYAGASPLIVVDGQPIPDGLAFVNPADVESIEVLKDAASAAIYGSRGASGVILVTTKSGKVDKSNFHFKYSVGAKTAYERYDAMTTTEYINRLYYEAALKAKDTSWVGPIVVATDNEKAGYIVEQQLLGGRGTNWQDVGLRTGLSQNIQLNASGGKAAARYYLSGAYQKDQGMMLNSNYEKYSFRSKFDLDLSSKVKLTININPSYSTREAPTQNFTLFVRYPSFLPAFHNELTAQNSNGLAQWANIQPGDFAQPRHFNELYYSGIMPDGSLWNPTGTSDPLNSSLNNPLSVSRNTSNTSNEYRLQSSAEMTIKLRKGLDFKSLASTYINYSTALNWANRNAEADGMVSRGVFNYSTSIDLLSENTFNYTKTIKDHAITLLAGFTAQKTKIIKDQITGLNFANDDIRTLNNAAQIDKSGTFGTKNQIGLLSYLGRVNYSFKNRYFVTASYRTDGSSYFGTGRKWGSFPSISGGWLVTQEKFMKKQHFFDKLKIRASYGVSGNNRILDFAFLDLLYPANYPFGPGGGTVTPGQVTSPTIRSNPDITWESTFQSNFGLDMSFFKNKINVNIDYYHSKTDRLLLQQSSMAFTGVPVTWNNIGSLQNDGIELELSTKNLSKGDLKWTTTANISHNQNKILELGNEVYLSNQGERNEIYRNIVGKPLIQFYGFKTDGIWLSQSEVDQAVAGGLSSPFSNAFVPGQLKIVDVDGNHIIDNNDRTIIGSPYPDFNWGITNNFTYGAFDLAFTFQGSQGAQIINGDPNYDETKKLIKSYNDNRWVSPMYPGDGRTPTYNKASFNWMLTDYVVEDASYFTLRDINLGYTIPEIKLKKLHFSSVRLFVSGQNLYYHKAKDYRGINPEARVTSGPYSSSLIGGYQRGAFPVVKSYLIGIDINF